MAIEPKLIDKRRPSTASDRRTSLARMACRSSLRRQFWIQNCLGQLLQQTVLASDVLWSVPMLGQQLVISFASIAIRSPILVPENIVYTISFTPSLCELLPTCTPNIRTRRFP